MLPAQVVEEVGTFKHNYQSVRVVDLLERRYAQPGINLTDQVREAILKHTSWKVRYAFPLPQTGGLFLDLPCHLEGQAVAVADEIAQQTHDLEDGLRAGSVALEAAEELAVARRVMDESGPSYHDERPWDRQNTLVRGMIRLFVKDVVETSAERIASFRASPAIGDPRRLRRSECARGLANNRVVLERGRGALPSSRPSSTPTSSTRPRSTARIGEPAGC